MTNEQELLEATREAMANELRQALGMIRHCLSQLQDDELWWRPDPSLNSIANLMLHLSGNVRQWIIAGLGGATDNRERAKEFSERGPVSKVVLLQTLQQTTDEALDVIRNASRQNLLAQRTIQGFDVNGITAVMHSVTHFRGHVQEIVHLTRRQRGDYYRFDFVPTEAPSKSNVYLDEVT